MLTILLLTGWLWAFLAQDIHRISEVLRKQQRFCELQAVPQKRSHWSLMIQNPIWLKHGSSSPQTSSSQKHTLSIPGITRGLGFSPFCCTEPLFEEFSPSQPSALVRHCVLPALLMAPAPCADGCEGTTVVGNFSLVAVFKLLKH